MSNDRGAPEASVWRSEDGTHWTVQIDTTQHTGPVAVDLNEGRIFYGDPEQFDPFAAAQAVLDNAGEGPILHLDTVSAVVDAVRGDLR